MDPNRPAVTPAQIMAVLIAGIPGTGKLLAAFGVVTLTQAQQDALSGALTWLGVVAGVLITADAGLRSARNAAHAKALLAPKPPASTGWTHTGTSGRYSSTWTEPRPGVSVTNAVTQPTPNPSEPAAPFTPDGDPADDTDTDGLDEDRGFDALLSRLAAVVGQAAPHESWIADPDDKDGADDHPEATS